MNISKYESDLFLLPEVLSKFTLTKREVEVLKYILLGKTAKQIAREMNLSYRTIEEYTEKIKCKLGCSYKSEIYSKIIQY